MTDHEFSLFMNKECAAREKEWAEGEWGFLEASERSMMKHRFSWMLAGDQSYEGGVGPGSLLLVIHEWDASKGSVFDCMDGLNNYAHAMVVPPAGWEMVWSDVDETAGRFVQSYLHADSPAYRDIKTREARARIEGLRVMLCLVRNGEWNDELLSRFSHTQPIPYNRAHDWKVEATLMSDPEFFLFVKKKDFTTWWDVVKKIEAELREELQNLLLMHG